MIFLFNVALALFILSLWLFINPGKKDADELQSIFQNKNSFKALTAEKEGKITRYFNNVQMLLDSTGRSGKLYVYFFASIILGCAGVFISLFLQNAFLIPVLSIFGVFLPFLKLRFDYIKYKHLVVEELDMTLRAVSISYERCENILEAVKENIPYMNMPVKKPFEEFVHRLKYVDPNMQRAIEELKGKIHHSVFTEWCDALIRCSQNRNLKYTLSPIVDKLTEIKIVLGETKNILYNTLHSYYIMVVLIVVLVAISLFVFPAVLQLQFPTAVRNFFIALNVAGVCYTSYKVALHTQDINVDF